MSELTLVTRTTLGAAVMRASHLLLDGEPKIFNDSLAQRLLGLSDDEVIRIRAGAGSHVYLCAAISLRRGSAR